MIVLIYLYFIFIFKVYFENKYTELHGENPKQHFEGPHLSLILWVLMLPLNTDLGPIGWFSM